MPRTAADHHGRARSGRGIATAAQHSAEARRPGADAPSLRHRGRRGGDGELVASGTPEDIAAEKRSYTGEFLKELLGRRPGKKAQAAE
ncbi:hypothetical protein ABMA32_18485 [Mesorhizobium sp. VNQ89]|uniref:hypothetical protein n=1 Tax=Mesorhizobium quangtriensis TaxID=3157709 RepID=UPI0032B787C9